MRFRSTAITLALAATPFASALAEDAGFWRGLLSTGATSATSYLTSRNDHKLVGAVQDDASSYVASAGAIRGPYLEAALQRLRADDPRLAGVSDLQLASAILAGSAE
ncbi:hypothetical protein D3C76_564290 [compost metagenome]|uniref:Uncharacterized protein n=2 Tax=Pseudomonas jinjuensis TaxID=198616 RepID=A0A1H0BGF2_9PSED|nr:DUF2388 domain-containing protein [Pseudomonas jinjuensis]SDN44708.1 conserverd hypothetical protein [Pseudomonas jinjuensis]